MVNDNAQSFNRSNGRRVSAWERQFNGLIAQVWGAEVGILTPEHVCGSTY